MQIAQQLPLPRCPHCSVPRPQIRKLWAPDNFVPRGDGGPPSRWAVYVCTNCGSLVTAKGYPGDGANNAHIAAIFPEGRAVHEDIPEPAKTFLQQAFDTLHAPDAAAVMSGSAVDAMLKSFGLRDGSLYSRIDEAVGKNILTGAMGDWAHEVRLGSNRPRHADEKKPHVTPDEAKQSVEFAEALGQFLFVLTAKIRRGTEQAKQASAQ